MTSWGSSVRALAVGAALLAACSNDSSGAPATTTERPTTTEPSSTTTSSTAPPRPTSTTTTMFDPTSVEGQVEAAYLKSWDVYAEAVYNLELDEKALAEVYAGDALATQISEVKRRISEGRASLVRVEHNYDITITNDTTVNVIDHFVNHQVVIDPNTKVAIEPDPNETLLLNFKLQSFDGAWKVVFIQKVNL